MHMQNLIKFQGFVYKILGRNEILTIYKGHNSVVNLRKWTRNDPSLDMVKVDTYQIQDIERKQNSEDIQGP